MNSKDKIVFTKKELLIRVFIVFMAGAVAASTVAFIAHARVQATPAKANMAADIQSCIDVVGWDAFMHCLQMRGAIGGGDGGGGGGGGSGGGGGGGACSGIYCPGNEGAYDPCPDGTYRQNCDDGQGADDPCNNLPPNPDGTIPCSRIRGGASDDYSQTPTCPDGTVAPPEGCGYQGSPGDQYDGGHGGAYGGGDASYAYPSPDTGGTGTPYNPGDQYDGGHGSATGGSSYNPPESTPQPTPTPTPTHRNFFQRVLDFVSPGNWHL